jgi:nucleoside-diphosphate-sugar epimerase
MASFPPSIDTVATLEELLSRPNAAVVAMMERLEGDIIFLGAGGKMGPTMARMARRATERAGVERRVIAASRFSNPGAEAELQDCGIETIRCDLLDPDQVSELPRVPNVVHMTGMKFGATGQAPVTWAMNTWLPSLICRHFAGSQIAAFSTGNVYGLTPLSLGGSLESDMLHPVGEYAMSAVGRERIFEYFAETSNTPVSLIRLNYANEMRYGVLVDIARRVWDGEPVDVAMGSLNAIWQGDANAMSLLALEHASSPAWVVNVAGPEQVSVRRVAETFGRIMNKSVRIEGDEAGDALLSNGQRGHRLFGYPEVSLSQMLSWIADWVMRDGASLNKPTHFENRAGDF